MAYLGAQPNKTLTKTTSQSFNGTGSATVFTLNRAVNTEEELEVFVENVQQEPGSGKSYTAAGTTLTFDEAPPSGTGNIYVIYRGLAEVTTRLEHDANQALSATTGTFSGAVALNGGANFGDSDKAQFGAGNDLQIYHDGTHSRLVDSGTGDLKIQTDGTGVFLTKGASETMGKFLTDGAVELYHDNSKKIETTSTGALITGELRQSTVQAVVQELSSVGFTSASTWVNLGDIDIPQSGIWMIRADLRLRGGGSGFVKGRIGTSSSGGEIGSTGGGGANTAIRMLKEQVGHEGSFYNLHVAPSWIIDCPTGATYPLSIYLHVQASASDSQNLNNNDANGRPTLSAIRVNGTTTTGSTVETIGGA